MFVSLPDDNTIGVLGHSVHDVLSQLKNACDPMLNVVYSKLHAG